MSNTEDDHRNMGGPANQPVKEGMGHLMTLQ